MPQQPRRKRQTRRKQKHTKVVDQPSDQSTEAEECRSSFSGSQLMPPSASAETESTCSIIDDVTCTENTHSMSVHHGFVQDCDYSKSTSECNLSEVNTEERPVCAELSAPSIPPQDLLMDVKRKVDMFLHRRWISFIENKTITVVCLSPEACAVTQRTLVFSLSGDVELYVHCQKIAIEPYMKNVIKFMQLHQENINDFVDRAVAIISEVQAMKVCCGYDDDRFTSVWSTCPFGFVDKNTFQEDRFEETFRSVSCLRLVSARKWRCLECTKLFRPLKRRSESALLEWPNLHTAHKFYTEQQKLQKLEDQTRQIYNATRNISRLKAGMQNMLKKNGVQVEQTLSDDLTEILESGSMTKVQAMFLQQQVKASQKKNMVGMRWHPTMIRLSLAIHLASPAAYSLMRDTGMVKLPSSRTLFDYSRVKPLEEGIDRYVLDSLGLKVHNFQLSHQKYHVLMADEMYVSQNLIFDKHSGKMIGYTSLDTVDAEVRLFEQYLDNPEKEVEAKIATKILVYMVKGVSNGVKEVVASFAVGSPSVSQMFDWTWKVIGALERSGVRVIAFVSDGFSTNRAFIRMHKPAAPSDNGVVFDTINFAARSRRLYFIADVPHLLKTIRNCLLNSRWDGVKSRRRMVKNGKKISWDFIVRLYNAKKNKSLRKAFKLNAMNVFPDSYARMKVKYAAEIISRTVAQDMEDEKWDDASETIAFLRLVNDWFDCLNGAHSSVGKKKRNPRLNPYTSENDARFEFMEQFLAYLEEWKNECESGNAGLNNTSAVTESSVQGLAGMEGSVIDEGRANDEPDTPSSKRMLSKPTLEGIEMTTRAFPHMVRFLLNEGTQFINARVFTQDPLEQHFSKVRAGQGGSTNPNIKQVLARNRAIHTMGQLGMKRSKGNSAEEQECIKVTSEPLAKRQCDRLIKFHQS